MKMNTMLRILGALAFATGLTACGNGSFLGPTTPNPHVPYEAPLEQIGGVPDVSDPNQSSIFDLFSNNDDPNVTVQVNKYLWNASLEVLNFLPIESVDPFTGVIITGYGTPPGGGRAYRATILVNDPALDARSLRVALQSRGGTVSSDTVRAVEDAILTRARQLRIRDSGF